MLNQYYSDCIGWLQKMMPIVMNEKNFPWMVGSLFLLGIVTKWMVVSNYKRLIRKAENMTHPKNATLRQIKMKYDGIKEVNGAVVNPMLLVQRHLNRCKVGIVPLHRLNHVMDWCTVLELIVAGICGWQLYRSGSAEMKVIAYIGIGCFLGLVLEMIGRAAGVRDRQTELAYVIVDYLENSPATREEKKAGEAIVKEEMEMSDTEEKERERQQQSSQEEENRKEEQILNQVIAEFLQ